MPIDINRPKSALLRGVRITEFDGHIINPDPVVLQETDFLLDEFLSPTKLKALTGVNDLAQVSNLEMVVDTSETSLGNFGIYLPGLSQLKLNGSHVPRIRDLGTSLVNLKVLWLSRSSLSDLDGIPTLSNLEEVYLAFNEITDLSPCSMLENLRCLDLEGNLIDDIKQIEFLNLCSNLKNLTLYANPICSKPSAEAIKNEDNEYDYRQEMIKILPDLKILDDELTINTSLAHVRAKTPADYQAPDNTHHECPFDDDWQLINQFIEEGIGPSEDKLAISESLRPGTSSSHNGNRISTGVRPLSSMRPLSSYRIKTGISSGSNSRGNTAESSSTKVQLNSEQIGDIINDSSNLTVGPALQGNPFKALLARKKPPANQKLIDQSESIRTPSPASNKVNLKNAIQNLSEPIPNKANESIDNEQLHAEINDWKKEHARKLEERKEYFEPQVLKIEDNPEATPLSDSEDEEEISKQSINKDIQITNEGNFRISRAKSAFKQHFDYEVNIDNDNEESPRAISRVRSASKDKNLFIRKIERNDSDLRLTTGDTGYDSLASASISSYQSLINSDSNVAYNLKPVLPPSAHKPKIVTTSILTTNNASNLKVNLKSNLKPLPGIKPPKFS